MKREEQIREEISLQLAGCFGNYSEGYEEGFIEGAKWADKTNAERIKKEAINKACEYFEPILCFETSKENANRIIEDFKKAMES